MRKILASPIEIQPYRTLGVIKADAKGWTDAVRLYIEEGVNFLLVLPNDPQEIKKFCLMFGLAPDCDPKPLTRSGMFRLGQFMEGPVFDDLLTHWSQDKMVLFIEQLDFPVNRPPRLLPFLLYSPVLGVLTQAATLEQVKEALEDHKHNCHLPSTRASIYLWHHNRWNLYEGR